MATQPFEALTKGDPTLLEQVESIVLDSHRRLWAAEGKAWSRPAAYHWLRYEDPMPVERLAEGVEKLSRSGAEFDGHAVDKACANAVASGFLN